MEGIEYKFEELEPVGYPGVVVEGWAQVEFDEYDDDFAIEAIFIGNKKNKRQVFYSEDFGKALFNTLYGPNWRGYIWDALKKYNEE